LLRVRKNAKPVASEGLAYIFVKMLAGPHKALQVIGVVSLSKNPSRSIWPAPDLSFTFSQINRKANREMLSILLTRKDPN
jgi:hypothetical protein